MCTLTNGQSVREGYEKFEDCKGDNQEILYIVLATNSIIRPKVVENLFF
jgi:hypothetical protein